MFSIINPSLNESNLLLSQFGVDEDGGSGEDYLKVDSAWHGDIDSDADSVDSEEEDFLK